MESNMKKIFQYMTTLLLLLVVGTSCVFITIEQPKLIRNIRV